MHQSWIATLPTLVRRHGLFKVETIGDAYLIVAGCPVKASNHALKICDMAFDMMDGIAMLKDPATGENIEMRRFSQTNKFYHFYFSTNIHHVCCAA